MSNPILRPIRIEGDLAYVPLTQGYEAIIDAEDAEAAGQHNWYARVFPHTVYAATKICPNGKQKALYLHRMIQKTPQGLDTDHADCNGLNNRKSNLRSCSPAQNGRNRKPQKGGSSRLKGVSFRKECGKWEAKIRINYKKSTLVISTVN
jgi:hypothetical protein